MYYDTAMKCFEENIQLFGNANNNPEKFNLYNGLANLAEGLKHDMSNIKSQIQYLQQAVNNIPK